MEFGLKKNKFGILYVDDEEKSLKYFKEAFDDVAPIYTANCAEEGLKVFQEQIPEIGVVVSDKKMPGMSGIEFLQHVRRIDDEPLRMLVTAHTDLKLAVEALNDGLLYSYLTKPWDPHELSSRLGRALDRFWITRERNKLLKERAVVFQELLDSEKAANIYTLSRGLNHHIKTSLTAVQAYFDMIPVQLEDEIATTPKDSFFWDTYYRNIEEHISRVIEILSNLSDGAYGPEVDEGFEDGVDIEKVIRDSATRELQDKGSVSLSVTKLDELHSINCHPGRVSMMVSQLVKEALRNTEESGEIEFQLFNSKLDQTDAVRVRCVDNGQSIPEEVRSHLFEPFYIRQDRPGDVGTGLLLCYLTVFQHGGKIRALELKDGRNAIEFILPVRPLRNLQKSHICEGSGA